MAPDMFICELLCFLQHNYGKIPKNELLSTLHGFYDEDEVSQAKDMLCDWASKLDGTPRVKARKVSSNRRRLEYGYILGFVEFLDKNKTELPVFVAVKLHRVPKMTPSDVDTVYLAETVADLKYQVTSMVSSINPMASRRPDKMLENVAKVPDGATSVGTDGATDPYRRIIGQICSDDAGNS